MDVSSLNSYATTAQAIPQGSGAAQKQSGAEKSTQSRTEEPAAVYAGSVQQNSVTTYTKTGQVKKADTSALIAESQQKMQQFAQMISQMLGKQASASVMANGNSDALFSKSNLQAAFQNASAEDVAWAKAQIADGGYYSVEATAERIFSVAESFAGGDPEKMAQMRAAVEKGFSQAAGAFGAALPDICQQTHTRLNEMFDNWGKGNTAATESEKAAG